MSLAATWRSSLSVRSRAFLVCLTVPMPVLSSDNEVPQLACPATISVSTAPGVAYGDVSASQLQPTASDNSGQPVQLVTHGMPALNRFPLGGTTVHFTAIDASGNLADCVTNVTVTGECVIPVVDGTVDGFGVPWFPVGWNERFRVASFWFLFVSIGACFQIPSRPRCCVRPL